MKNFYYLKKIPGKIYFELLSVLFALFILLALLVVPYASAQQFGSLVTYLDTIDFDGDEGNLSYPSFVMVVPPENDVYIIDKGGRITIYTSDLFPVYTVKKGSHIQAPLGMAIDVEGNIYIAQAASKDNPRARISVFRQCLKWERDIYLDGFEGVADILPAKFAIDKKGFIYVASSTLPGILIFENSGRFVDIIAPEDGKAKVDLNNVTIDGEGRIYLLSATSGRVYVYDENRKFLYKFGEKGGSSGKLSRPMSITVDDRTGRKYLVDYMRHTVNVYDEKGDYIFEFGGFGWGDGWFQFPVDIKIDSEGKIFVADLFNNRVQVFNSW